MSLLQQLDIAAGLNSLSAVVVAVAVAVVITTIDDAPVAGWDWDHFFCC